MSYATNEATVTLFYWIRRDFIHIKLSYKRYRSKQLNIILTSLFVTVICDVNHLRHNAILNTQSLVIVLKLCDFVAISK